MVLCCLQRSFCNFVSKTQIDNRSKQYHIEKPSFCFNCESMNVAFMHVMGQYFLVCNFTGSGKEGK